MEQSREQSPDNGLVEQSRVPHVDRACSETLLCFAFVRAVKPGDATGHTKHNGVTRFVKGTQNTFEPTPALAEVTRQSALRVVDLHHVIDLSITT